MPDYCRLGNLRENILSFSCNSDKIVEMKRYVNHITLLSIDKTWRFMLFAIDNFCKIDTFLLLLECTRTYSCMHISEPEKMSAYGNFDMFKVDAIKNRYFSTYIRLAVFIPNV